MFGNRVVQTGDYIQNAAVTRLTINLAIFGDFHFTTQENIRKREDMREGGERKLANEAVVSLRSQDPDMGIIFRGVGAKPIPHLDSELVAALRGVELTEQARAAVQAADTIRAVVEHAKAAQRDLVKLRQDLESEREKHDATLDRERAKRESVMACERAEVEAIKKATLELKAKVEADAAAVKWIRDDLMRRLSSLPRNQPEYLRAYTT